MGKYIHFTTPTDELKSSFPLKYQTFIRRFNKYTSHAVKDFELTSLKSSEMTFEKWVPAPITPEGEYKSISNYNREGYLFESAFKDFLFDWWDEELVPILGPSAFKRLESFEAVEAAIPGDSMSASPGLPCTMAGFRTKREVFDSPDMRAYLKRVFDEPLPTYIFNICLKNELRPEAKALEHKIRTFCIANLEHMIVSLKYFSNFSEAMVRICGKRFSCVGFSQYHGEWDRLIKQYIGYMCWAKDGSKFDYRMFSQFLLFFFEWFGFHAEIEDLQYEIWVHMTVCKVIVSMQGFVFLAVGSNPSGHFLTALLNTLFNNALNIYAFWKHCQPMKPRAIRSLYRKIMMERDLGDDSLEGVLLEYSHFYNVNIQIGILGKILDYTTSSVPGSVLDQDFLSLRTTIDPVSGRYVPYPFSTRWWSSLDYSFKNLTPVEKLNKLCSMRLHAYYNKIAFVQISNIAKAYMEKYRHRVGEVEWDNACRQFFSERQIRAIYHNIE